jgi:hypothetical protein
MAFSLFGFEFRRAKENTESEPTFIPKESDDGAVTVAAAGAMGQYIDLDGAVRTEAELVTRYREMSLQPEVDTAIDEIVNELIDVSADDDAVKIILDDVEVSEKVKKTISEEFDTILRLLDFNHRAYEILRRWYIDGRLYYHVVIDVENPRDGIKELRYIDPRKIRKIREISKKRVANKGDASQGDNSATVASTEKEYYVFTERGFNYGNKVVGPSTQGLKIAKDSILHLTSGLTDTQGTMVLSYLHKAIKAVNQLRTLEDAVVIYRLARAPERRLWYIDVGNLPKMKAEQYVRDIMVKHKNRLTYDASTGAVSDQRKFLTMLEDYWLPRREGGRGTEVSTLPAGQNLGEMADVEYFQKRLYGTLNVPINRLDKDSMFSLGRSTEITRDEIKFFKFITRLRSRFVTLFSESLGKQLILKGLMSIEEWEQIQDKIKFDFSKDNHFAELKSYDVIQSRLNTLGVIQPYIGMYYSHEWVLKNILQMNDDDIEEMREKIEEEMNDPIYSPQQQDDGMQVQGGDEEEGGQQGGDEDDEEGESDSAKLANAYATYRALKDKENKTDEEKSEFRSAVTIISHAQRRGVGYVKHPKEVE